MYYYWRRVGRPSQSKTQPRALHNIRIQTVLKRSPSGASELQWETGLAAIKHYSESFLRSKTELGSSVQGLNKNHQYSSTSTYLLYIYMIKKHITVTMKGPNCQWDWNNLHHKRTVTKMYSAQSVVCYSHNSLNTTRLQFRMYCILHPAIQWQKHSWTSDGSYFSGCEQIANTTSIRQNVTIFVTSTFFERHFLAHSRRPETLSACVAVHAAGKEMKVASKLGTSISSACRWQWARHTRRKLFLNPLVSFHRSIW